MLPFLMRSRTESLVYFDLPIEVGGTLGYIDRQKADEVGEGITLFQVVLCAAARTLALRPRLNRFVAGRRLYQRETIDLSFAIKKALTDDAPITTVKVRFDPHDTLSIASRRIREAVQVGRGGGPSKSDREMRTVSRLPRFLVRFLVRAQRALDYFNLLPAGTIRSDPLYASAFLANLGSLGIDAAYHHLYEYGTVPVFGTIGRVKKIPVVDEDGAIVARDVMETRWSFDERIADGFYCARSLEIFRSLVQHPERLERPADLALEGSGPAADGSQAPA